LSFVIAGSERLHERIDQARLMDRLFAQIEADCQNRQAREVRRAGLIGESAEDHAEFALTTTASDEQGGYPTWQRRYRWQQGRLERISQLDPDLHPAAPAHREVLFEAVEDMRLRFLDQDLRWQPVWAAPAPDYPRAMEVTLRIGRQHGRRLFVFPE
jgi:type II secretory pathway component PulJ